VIAIAMALAPPDSAAASGPGVTLGPDGMPVARVLGLADAIDPRNILRLLSLYQMKDRAGTVGTNGVADLLRRMLGATGAGMRVCGHSFGAKVMLSALCAPVQSILPFNDRSFSPAGAMLPLLAKNQRSPWP
jgi:hypothetical protein